MNKSVAIGMIAFIAVGSSTSADAHSVERVRRELTSQGYDQIEFKRTKFPVWVSACRGGTRVHLHVDWYGKVTVTDDTPEGSCRAENENSNISSTPSAKDNAVAEKSPQPKVESKKKAVAVDEGVGCKKFFPEIGMTVTVPCE